MSKKRMYFVTSSIVLASALMALMALLLSIDIINHQATIFTFFWLAVLTLNAVFLGFSFLMNSLLHNNLNSMTNLLEKKDAMYLKVIHGILDRQSPLDKEVVREIYQKHTTTDGAGIERLDIVSFGDNIEELTRKNKDRSIE